MMRLIYDKTHHVIKQALSWLNRLLK